MLSMFQTTVWFFGFSWCCCCCTLLLLTLIGSLFSFPFFIYLFFILAKVLPMYLPRKVLPGKFGVQSQEVMLWNGQSMGQNVPDVGVLCPDLSGELKTTVVKSP